MNLITLIRNDFFKRYLNQKYVDFPANQTTYDLVRNGNWGQASIPVSDIRGEYIDLRMLSYEFVILEVNLGWIIFTGMLVQPVV